MASKKIKKTKKESLKQIKTDLLDIWAKFDQMFESMSEEDWTKPHGKDWTFADVPYHFYYFDKVLVIDSIKRGNKVTKKDQKVLKTIGKLNKWNAKMFKARPKKQTVYESLKQWKQARNSLLKLMDNLKESDLSKPAYSFLPGTGWLTIGMLLIADRGHHWNHLHQFRLHLKKKEPLPNPSSTKGSLNMYMNFMPIFMDPHEVAQTKKFTTVMDFQKDGAWTVQVINGKIHVIQGKDRNPDLVMSQSAETFIKTFTKMHNPMIAILLGKIKVKGFKNMGKFGKLMKEPKLDQEVSLIE